MNNKERADLAKRIESARVAARLSKEAAARKAKVTTTTWRRAESGLRVHDTNLQAILNAVGLSASGEELIGSPEIHPNEIWAEETFALPPEIENGYKATATYASAIQEYAPPLSERATRLMLDAAGLLADSGRYLLDREGGDGDAEDTRGTAAIGELSVPQRTNEDLPAAALEEGSIADQQEGQNEP